MLQLVDTCNPTLQAEIWSIFTAILRKSTRNLQACTEVGLIEKALQHLQESDEVVGDLLIDMMGVLASYSITVKELKLLFGFLKASNGKWPRHAVKLISVLRHMPQRHGPDEFFSFPGKTGACIALPPIAKWPYQNGWTFSTWIRLDPVSGGNIEREKPYLYTFRTAKGLGYSAHFIGSALVITAMKIAGKGFQHCVNFEFQPKKWYMVTLVHVYRLWGKSEVQVYVDGQMVSTTEMSWLVSGNEPFNKCFIGTTHEQKEESMFCGQMSTIYMFSEALQPQYIDAIYHLGPAYKSQFRFTNECDTQGHEILFDDKFHSSIVMMYNPIACDGQLCLESSPKGNPSIFVHTPHALMLEGVKAVVTHSIHSTLHSLGGIQTLFPLFGQLDCVQESASEEEKVDHTVCSTLLALLCDLLESSVTIQQQMLQNRGFLVISYLLEKASREHLSEDVLNSFLKLTKYLVGLPNGGPLLKQLFDHVLFNPALWIHSPVAVQTKLWTYMSTEFIADAQIYTNIRRVSAVLQTMHSLKYYYWVTNPKDRSGITPKGTDGPRPAKEEIIKLRSLMLSYLKQLIMRGPGIYEDELQSLLNFLTTVHEDENLSDVLSLVVTLMAEHPSSMVPGFDRKNGIRTVFKLLASPSEMIRIHTLKFLGFFLMRSTHKRKHDSMGPHNLFSLLSERLCLHSNELTMNTYNVLFEVLTERMSKTVIVGKHPEPDNNFRIENSLILKVVATLIRQSRQTESLMEVKKVFLSDLMILCNNNKDNRRTILQMSVWQDWLFSMAYTYPRNQEERKITGMVMALFKMLLHHAIKIEYGGWRVWIDTLAILHSKISYEDFRIHMSKVYRQYEQQRVDHISDPQARQTHPVSTISGISDEHTYTKPAPKSTVTVTEIKENGDTGADSTGSTETEQRVQDTSTIEGKEQIQSGDKEQEDSPSKVSENASSPVKSVSEMDGAELEKGVREFLNEVIQNAVKKVEEEGKDGQEGGNVAQEKTEVSVESEKDTLAGVHGNKAESQEHTEHESSSQQSQPKDQTGDSAKQRPAGTRGQHHFSPGPRAPPFRIPDFNWSTLHQLLLSDLLFAVEQDVQVWKTHSSKTVLDFVNASDNHIFVVNTIHMISQLADGLITACGGLLPLLAAATSPSGEMEILEASHGLTLEQAISFLHRLVHLADIMLFASTASLPELEQEKNMASGGILRQCLRMVCTAAVRNCLECRHREFTRGRTRTRSRSGSVTSSPTGLGPNGIQVANPIIQSLINGIRPSTENIVEHLGSQENPVKDPEKLLQEMDINRLRAVVYRDIEETKQAQFLSLAIVYFVSVLMVSKYRDILEPPSIPSTPSTVGVRIGRSASQIEEEEESVSPRRIVTRPDADVAVTRPPEDHAVSRANGEVAASKPGEEKTLSSGEPPAPQPTPDDTGTETASEGDADKVNESEKEEEQGETEPADEKLDSHSEEKSEEAKVDEEGDKANVLRDIVAQAMEEGETEKEDTEKEEAVENGEPETSDQTTDDSGGTEKTQEPVGLEEVSLEEEGRNDRPEQDGSQEEVEEFPHPEHQETAQQQQQIPPHTAPDAGDSVKPEEFKRMDADPHAENAIASIQFAGSAEGGGGDGKEERKRPESFDFSKHMPGTVENLPAPEDEGTLTERLERALGTSAPLLREIFVDFAPYLSKTLMGSHGQELLVGGLVTLKQSTSVVELVMLLCSQEWQNSLQKHAGLAFIELVNEGRLLAHATRDHVVRVANEAEFILNRMRAEDVQKHAEFESLCAQSMHERREEEKLCDHLISSARRRDHVIATKLRDKVINIMTNKHGAWGSEDQSGQEFWKLDSWEDDSRRRRRFVRNPYGSTHPEAALKAAIEHGAAEDAVNSAREALHAHLAAMQQKQQQQPDFTDEELMAVDEKELEIEFAGPVALTTPSKLVAPGVVINGTMSITKSELYFELDEEDASNKKIDQKLLQHIEQAHGKWHFSEIRAIFSRRYLLQNVAIEIFMANRTAVMFAFPDHATVKKVINALPPVGIGVKYGLPQRRKSSLATAKQLYKLSNMTEKWRRRELSNYDYLMYLNTIAGRTYNDMNQYPVFPWIISNYDSSELDLSLPSNYRDLSKPIGALNPSRRAFFEERYSTWEHESIPPFHYGTHYSTSAFVLNFLIRIEPFTSMFLNLQGGKFDHANRTFHSISQTWKNCQRDTSDVKELLPEFFFLPEMFVNNNGFNFGKQEDGTVVNDVILPQWAKNGEEFVRINRMALESEFVSCQLHQWIDLIFGYKQRGPEAVRAANVFYYLTYEGSVDLENMKDPVMKEAIENQIRSFGQTPSQLLTEPHPPRSSAMHVTPMMFSNNLDDVCMIMKFLSNSPVVHLTANTHPFIPNPAVVTIASNHNFSINKWNNNPAPPTAQQPSLGEKQESMPSLPLLMDQALVQHSAGNRRNLGDNFDERLKPHHFTFVTTVDNKYIFATQFWDKSFRVFHSDTAKIQQVVFGHFDVVTCISRSECSINQDCYIVTGAKDCTIMVWHWSSKNAAILGDNGSIAHPTPKATLTGHHTEVTCVAVSTELGLVISGSKDGPCLVHTTNGDLLRSLEPPKSCISPKMLSITREGYIIVNYDKGNVCLFSLSGKFLRHSEHSDNLWHMILSRDGQYLLTAGERGVVDIWRTHDLNILYSYPQCDSKICSLALSHDQKYLMAGMGTGCIVVFNIDFNKWHHEFQDRYG
ncbi:neurobeachin [Lingula anatina]|uniref:Neurobeachin n=1 Tax=Lingula anatina TaxID=7574 RepID=A0A1S3KC15_LINAN|nr:neurobeachin [Lingula anatina]|eukprot:XP_013420037.2 neurobeachin [Lingula anatina]